MTDKGNDIEVIEEAELVEADSIQYPALADFSEIEYVAWPLGEARHRAGNFINKYPGYAEEGARALGYITLAETLLKSLEHKTYGDYGHVA